MNEQAIRLARQYHAQHQKYRRSIREQRRQELYQRVSTAIQRLAPAYPALRAVYLYGSLVQPGRYGARSDIDVAVACDDPAVESRFWQELEAELKHDVDLRSYRGSVAWAVNSYGECIYEREVPSTRTLNPA